MKEAQQIKQSLGSATKHMTAAEIKRDYPFYNMDDIVGGNHNLVDEGYFDGGTVFDWWKRSAKEKGAEYVTNQVVSMTKNDAGSHAKVG